MPKKKKQEEVENAQDAIITQKVIDLLRTACNHTAYSPLDEEIHYKKLIETFEKLANNESADPIQIVKIAVDIALHKRWSQIDHRHLFASKFDEITNRDVVQCNICGKFFVDYETLEEVVNNAQEKISQIALMKGYQPETNHKCECDKNEK